jgi:glycosyltransferase involved in cell wall biosynthesis
MYDILRAIGDDNVIADASTLLFFGRISAYKGIEVLYSAAQLVSAHIPRLKLMIVGAPVIGYEPPRPPPLANDGICECSIRNIPCEEIGSWFRRATLVVLPYTQSAQSGVLATAYAFHKPVVATTVGGLQETVEHGVTGYLVPPNDPQALASAITDLLLHANKRQEMAEEIRRKEQDELAWPRLVDMTLDVYQAVLEGKARTRGASGVGCAAS